MNVFVFDIETIPDIAGARRLWSLDETLDDDGVVELMTAKRLQETSGSSDFLRSHMHRIVAISAVFREGDRFNVWSLGEESSDEAELVRRFFEGVERYTPTLVSWNGGGFDLPVLHYRALLHGIAAPRYWDTGDDDRSFRYNNYLGRFHWRHIDLMDVLAGYQARAYAPLDQLATLMGLPGKLGMSGAKVWDAFRAGQIGAIRDYCETDVLNTWLLYLRFQHLRGHLSDPELLSEMLRVREFLAAAPQPHFQAFLQAWESAPAPEEPAAG